jgi:hypothetical protein
MQLSGNLPSDPEVSSIVQTLKPCVAEKSGISIDTHHVEAEFQGEGDADFILYMVNGEDPAKVVDSLEAAKEDNSLADDCEKEFLEGYDDYYQHCYFPVRYRGQCVLRTELQPAVSPGRVCLDRRRAV